MHIKKKMIVKINNKYYKHWYRFSDRHLHVFKCISIRNFSRQLSDMELCNQQTKGGYSVKFIENGMDRAALRIKYGAINVLKKAGLLEDGYSRAKKRFKQIAKISTQK